MIQRQTEHKTTRQDRQQNNKSKEEQEHTNKSCWNTIGFVIFALVKIDVDVGMGIY
jgi:hypothetical protein